MPAMHPDTASTPSFRRRWVGVAAAAMVAIVTLVPVVGASASVGSTPPDVTLFANADDGLLLELEEFFGQNQRGSGLDFTNGIELGAIDRVFLWSNDYHSGQSTETPVQYVNRWMVPVTIGEEPVGVAMIGIDPATVDPEMIDFIRRPGVALALDDVDDDATLVQEPETGAWFSLLDGVITPLVRGSSEVAGEMTLEAYQPIVSTRLVEVVDETPQPDQGSVQSVVLIVTTIVVVLLVLLIPTVVGQVRERRERRAAKDGPAVDTDEALDEAASAGDSDATESDVALETAAPAGTAPPTSVDDEIAVESEIADEVAGVQAATAAVKKPAAKRAPAKKAPAKNTPAKKAPSKKAAAPKTTAATVTPRKTPAKASAAKATTTAVKKTSAPTAPKTPAKPTSQSATATATTAASKPAAAKPAAKKRAPQPAASKPTTSESAAKKPAASKPATKKPAPKKPAPKKPVPKNTSPSAGADATDSAAD
ncbi:hypothetical protein I6E68_11890 [Salinibacterium sp. NSLL150]|uniref:hypothetical protein n=1 Tax=unclassified Salinibacterium TaxID=2632331 RepID=UPI0018CE7C3C|nr:MULTISPECIES: hypothetical protein [unclassified Salinibacterium]MBH0099836.1 hypothetical protein [Salinibacterium sp. NSLL35]MBH0102590.1 hypothetical protein [Salinibacterium sp. NSLL150]MBH0105350.1 hypothetical protein [Salinibacterium sp. NSLL16]MBH0108110.1 hypothetical protein [Salinibacterium sp. NSLL17]